MIRFVLGLWLAVSLPGAAESQSRSAPAPPRSLDSRLVFERIAAEPEIVTPTGIAVDSHGRVMVIESHTHFRPKDYQGPPADRIRVFEDRDHDGKPECAARIFEGTRMTMGLAVARDGSVFVATRSALYRLWDRDGDGRADGGEEGGFRRRSFASTPRATILTTVSRASRSTSRATSISAWAKTWVPITDSLAVTERRSPAAAKEAIFTDAGPTAQSSSASPPGSGTRSTWRLTCSDGCSPSITIPTRARLPLAAHRRRRRLRLPFPQRSQGAAPLHRLER